MMPLIIAPKILSLSLRSESKQFLSQGLFVERRVGEMTGRVFPTTPATGLLFHLCLFLSALIRECSALVPLSHVAVREVGKERGPGLLAAGRSLNEPSKPNPLRQPEEGTGERGLQHAYLSYSPVDNDLSAHSEPFTFNFQLDTLIQGIGWVARMGRAAAIHVPVYLERL